MFFLETDFQSAADTYENISTHCLHKFGKDVDKYGMELANVNELPLASSIDTRTGQMFCRNTRFSILENLSSNLCSLIIRYGLLKDYFIQRIYF